MIFQCRRDGDHFERGPRLIDVGDGPVALHCGLCHSPFIRVHERHVGQGEQLARARVHDDGRGSLGVILPHSVAEDVLGPELDGLVDGQPYSGAGLRVTPHIYTAEPYANRLKKGGGRVFAAKAAILHPLPSSQDI